MNFNRTTSMIRNFSTPTSMPPIKPKPSKRYMSGCKYNNHVDWIHINNTPKNINFNKDLNNYVDYRNKMIYDHNKFLRRISTAQINFEIKRQINDIKWETQKALEHAFKN